MSNKDTLKGTAKKSIGKAKEIAGVTVNDRKLEGEGKLEQAEGKGQETVGKIKDGLEKDTDREEEKK